MGIYPRLDLYKAIAEDLVPPDPDWNCTEQRTRPREPENRLERTQLLHLDSGCLGEREALKDTGKQTGSPFLDLPSVSSDTF